MMNKTRRSARYKVHKEEFSEYVSETPTLNVRAAVLKIGAMRPNAGLYIYALFTL